MVIFCLLNRTMESIDGNYCLINGCFETLVLIESTLDSTAIDIRPLLSITSGPLFGSLLVVGTVSIRRSYPLLFCSIFR
jgi:hypothetical protein